jgi:hypothetical protein
MSERDDIRPDSCNGRDLNDREAPDRELPDRELLVAYLDGELDADQARQVEQLISRDSRAERELKQLERVWSLLDRLPRAEVGPSFTQSTVEMVALAVEDDLRGAERKGPARNAAWSAAFVAACLLGFVGARLWPDPNRQLLRDLPVIDHVEAYRQTPQIDFLRELARSGAFDGEAVETFAAASIEERRKRFDSLSSEQKEDLQRKYERFSHLPADEQDRLRKLEAAVASDNDAVQLSATLARFQQWLEQLPGVERAELMALDGEQRLQRVKRLRRDEARRLAPEDVPAFTAWFAGVFPKILPPAARAKVESELAQASDDQRPAIIRRAWLARQALWQQARSQRTDKPNVRPAGAGPLIKPQALGELEKVLSPRGQHVLNNASTVAERRNLILSWVNQTFVQPAARANQLSLPDVDEDDLKRFFEQLSPVQRTHLLNLPADQMKRQLLARYQAKRAPEKKQKTQPDEPQPTVD